METQSVLPEHQETFFIFYSKGDWALAQVAWEAVESTLRDIQKPSGHSPGQPVLSNPAAADKLDKVTSWGPFQPQLFNE